MDEIATGSFKLDACGGPKQAGPFLSVERRLKKKSYMKLSNHFNLRKKIYQILRRSTTNSREVFFSFKSIKTERVIIITVLFRGCLFSFRAFFFGIENSLTIFELHPSDMAKNVHPYIASFSF